MGNALRRSMRQVATACCLSLWLADARGQLIDVQGTAGRISTYTSGDEWTKSIEYSDLTGYVPRPAEEVLQQIGVEWQAPELDELGNICAVRGRLTIPGSEPNQRRPVDWFQGITLYVAMTPNAKPDWSGGMNRHNTEPDTGVVLAAGEFRFYFDVRDLQKLRSASESFQFGLALADHSQNESGDTVVRWHSAIPAIAGSVRMLEIPPAAKLSPELELINSASGWPFRNPDSVDLIRAVNALQRLGKNEALNTLDRYVELTNSFDYWQDHEIVFWIMRVLFEPVRLDDRIPRPMIAVYLVDRDSAEGANWPLNPMALVDDVPFMIGHRIFSGGMPEHPSSHIQWARKHGVMRDEPLRPTVSPLLAAESILASPQSQRLDEYARKQAEQIVREHAYKMVDDLLPLSPPRRFDDAVDEAYWRAQVETSAAAQITWDAKQERFIRGDTPPP